MPQKSSLNKSRLREIIVFLSKVRANNESTEYSADQEYVVEAIMDLVKAKGRMDIMEEFETPYIHPLITIQKWVDQLKLVADEALSDAENR
jgi:hypothetical protein